MRLSPEVKALVQKRAENEGTAPSRTLEMLVRYGLAYRMRVHERMEVRVQRLHSSQEVDR